jgi:prepilin-type N-terminal cleavage/methylation domain-containing protein
MKDKTVDIEKKKFFSLKTHCHGGRAFTLVELLLVIAIIGILASVLISVVSRQRENARATAFKEQMRTLVAGVTSCLDEGGTIQAPDANVDRRICSTGISHGTYSLDEYMIDCDGDGSYAINSLADGIQGVCNLNGGTTCTAVCSYNGCKFGVNCN